MAITIEIRAFFSPLNDIAMPDAMDLGRWAMAKQRVGEMKGRWLEVASVADGARVFSSRRVKW